MKATFLLIIFCAILLASIGVLLTHIQTLRDDRDQAIEFNNARQDSVQYLVNKLGQETAKAKVLELSERNLRKMQDDERLSWIRNFEGVNRRLSNVEQASRTTASVVANFKMELVDTMFVPKGDTIKARKFDNRDKWFRLHGVVLSDSIIAIPELDIPIENVIYLGKRTKRFLFFRVGPKEILSQSTTQNPYARITKSEVTRIRKQK